MNTGAHMGLTPAKAFTSQHALEEMNWYFGPSKAMQSLRKRVSDLQGNKGSALLQGANGVGKSLLARLLHDVSGAEGHFITFDVVAVPPNRIESELAQAMQSTARDGQWGTLYLVGVESLPTFLQKRLLQHYLSCEGAGSVLPTPRLICASTQNIPQMVEDNLFSEQLYRILKTHVMNIPALETRPEDIAPIAQYMARQYSAGNQKKLSKDAIKALASVYWSGNLRQLAATMQQAMAGTERHILGEDDIKAFLPKGSCASTEASVCLPSAAEDCLSRYFDNLRGMAPAPDLYDRIMGEVEKPLLRHVLRYVRGNQLRAAEVLGINRNTLRKKIRQWEIDAKNIDGKDIKG